MLTHEKFRLSNLSITSWNIHGLFSRIEGFRYSNLQSPYFWDMVGKAKIFGLIESHHLASEIDQIQIDGFTCFNVCTKKRKVTGEGIVGELLFTFVTQ